MSIARRLAGLEARRRDIAGMNLHEFRACIVEKLTHGKPQDLPEALGELERIDPQAAVTPAMKAGDASDEYAGLPSPVPAATWWLHGRLRRSE